MLKTISNISDLFMYSLQLHGKASFPGLGTIQVYRKPAFYAENRKKILPPETSLAYDHTIDERYNILNLGHTLEVDQKNIDIWSSGLTTFLQSKNSEEPSFFELAGIGHFENHAGTIQFKQDNSSHKFNSFAGWPEIDVIPLSLNKKNIHFAIEQPRELIFPGKKKEKLTSSFTFPLLLIGIVLIVLCVRFFNSDEAKPFVQIGKKENTLIQKGNILKETKNKPAITEEINIQDSAVTVSQAEVTGTNTIAPAVKTRKINQPNDKISTSEFEGRKDLLLSGQCSYVPGAFTRKKNALNLRNKLQKQGYQVEILKNNKFYRVAVWLPCQNDTSAPFKKLIAEYPETWLLEK